MGRASNRKWAKRAGRVSGMRRLKQTARALEYLNRLGEKGRAKLAKFLG